MPDGGTLRRLMGEMGRKFDGNYAEYALLPKSLLMLATTHRVLDTPNSSPSLPPWAP